jgi:4-aminobutyrate aminotransferase-like enzyme
MEPYCYRCPFGKKPDSCSLECAKNVETTIQTSTHGKIAAFIAEPVMGVGGFIAPPKEYFEEVVQIVHRYGGKYISDEVQTGAGRTGESFLFTKALGIKADMVTMAKGLGNGAAIGATMMKTESSDSMAGKLFFNTFGSDPYQTMQAKVTLEVIREEKLMENAKAMGTYLQEGIKNLMKNHSLIGEVRGRGLLMGFELVKDRESKEHAIAETVNLMEKCREKGLLVGKGGLFGNVIRIAPSLSINQKQCDRVLKVIDECLTEMKKEV